MWICTKAIQPSAAKWQFLNLLLKHVDCIRAVDKFATSPLVDDYRYENTIFSENLFVHMVC